MIAIVTGCAQGIGNAILNDLLDEGFFVYGIDKNEKQLNRLERTTIKPHQFIVANLAVKEDLEKVVQEIVSKNEKIDLIINNACFTNHGLLSECSYEQFNEVLFTGVSAPYFLALKFKNHFSSHANIINISSTRARQSQKDTESYSAAKGAIEALTRAMAMSLQGICRVNCIAPGWIDTVNYDCSNEDKNQHPSSRVGTVFDIVKAVRYLKDKNNDFVNATILNVDGGMSAKMIYHGDEGWNYE